MPMGKGTYGSKVGRPKKKAAMNKGGMAMVKNPKTGKMMPEFAQKKKGMMYGGMASKKKK
tara:strand:- start:476 stop:655 length:180 start_codon:yes stop_codon:yes gene_type:complete